MSTLRDYHVFKDSILMGPHMGAGGRHAIGGYVPGMYMGAEAAMTVDGASVAWTPTEITTEQWLDYNDSSTLTWIDGRLSAFEDKSLNNRGATQVTAANRPVDSAGLLSFDGLTQFMTMNVPQSRPCHIFWVIDTTILQSAVDKSLLGRYAPSSPYPPGVYFSGQVASRPQLYWGTGYVCQYPAVIEKKLMMFELIVTATEAGWRLDGGTRFLTANTLSAMSYWNSFPSDYLPQTAAPGLPRARRCPARCAALRRPTCGRRFRRPA